MRLSEVVVIEKIKNKDIKNHAYKIFVYLISITDLETGKINKFNQSELAKKLDLAQSQISNSIKILIEYNFIKKINYDYFINEELIN